MGRREHSHRAMDTEFRFVFGAGEDAALCASAAAAAAERLDALETLLSRFNDTGDVAVIRALASGRVATVAPETMDVLLLCARVCAATGGAFDPTVGALMAALRRERDGRPRAAAADWTAADGAARDDLFARGGFSRLTLDPDNRRVAVAPDRLGRPTPLALDFGGIGKGYAVDECRRLFTGEQFALRTFLIDAGSSTVWAQGSGWTLGAGGAWKGRTRRRTELALDGAALSGSGFERQGEHVIDIRRRRPAARWAHAWVLCPDSAAVADALSTAALAMTGAELAAAARALRARVLAARRQPRALDRLRDPLALFP